MSLRIRQVKPDFWRDSIVAALPDSTRLVYIGLWMEADDAGWMRLDVTTIAADLYPYSPRAAREKRVKDALDELIRMKRIEELDCGHAFVTNLTRHQRLSAPDKRVLTFSREHERCLAGTRGDPRETAGNRGGVTGLVSRSEEQIPAGTRGSPPTLHTLPTRNGKEGEVKGREGGVQGGSAPRSMKDLIKINDDGRFEVAGVTLSGPER